METFKKLWSYIDKYKLLLVLSVLLAGVTVILTLYVPYIFGEAIDTLIGQGSVDFNSLSYYLFKISIIVVLIGVFTWIMNIVNNKLTYRVVEDIRNKVINHLQHLPLKYLDGQAVGDITSRMIADVDQLSDGLLLGFTKLFSGIITIVMTLYFMFTKSVIITLMVMVLTPLSFFVSKFIAKHSYNMYRKQNSTRGEQTALIEEMISGQKVVRAFNYENTSSLRFSNINKELQEYSTKATFYSSLTNPSTRAVNSIIYAVVVLSGSHLIMLGNLSVGGLSVLLSYANQYMKPFNDISSVVTELQNAFACAERVFNLLDESEEVKDSDKVIDSVSGQIDINDVAFSYSDKPFIEHFDLHAKSGQRIAIVGPTGCGKTTFINLLMRFYDINGGSIMIDGTNIYDISRESLRSQFGMVLQETWLKNGTVRDNLIIGNKDASDEEIIEVCKKTKAYNFIRRLPRGLDTVLTDDSLSQGQKQLLCISRVMLCNPKMLILDEATSSIDTRTELIVQNAFDMLMKGRTSFIVAHRLSTIVNADIILVMKDGKIIESGNHESLLKANGFYTNLYNSQFVKA